MNEWILAEYRRLRRLGWTAQSALRAARTKDAFDDAENEGLVKLGCEPEFACIEAFEPDFEGYPRKCDGDRARKEYRDRAEREGVWILVSYFRPTEDDPWEAVDSVGGFIGDDWRDSGYDTDLKRAALDALDASRTEAARELEQRATYAGVSP